MSTLSGACVLCVLVRHLMGSTLGAERLGSLMGQGGSLFRCRRFRVPVFSMRSRTVASSARRLLRCLRANRLWSELVRIRQLRMLLCWVKIESTSAVATFGCSLMGQGRKPLPVSTLSGACVLCVLVRHLMGSAGCRAARLKSQSASGWPLQQNPRRRLLPPWASLLLGARFRPPVSWIAGLRLT